MIHVFRLGPLPSSGSHAYVGLPEGGEPTLHEAPTDRGGLEALKGQAPDQTLSCEPALADAAKALGLESAPLPPDVLRTRAVLAFELASGIQHGASKPDAIAAFLKGAAAFWTARSWEIVAPEERLRVAFLEGHAEVDGELSVVGGDGMRLPGVALCDSRGALGELAELDGDARAEAALRLADLTVDLERDPAWATEALEEGYGLARLPMAVRKRNGSAAPMVTQDLLVAAALLEAIAAWTGLEEEGAVGEGTAEAAGMKVVARVRESERLPPAPAEGLTPVGEAPASAPAPEPAPAAAPEPAPAAAAEPAPAAAEPAPGLVPAPGPATAPDEEKEEAEAPKAPEAPAVRPEAPAAPPAAPPAGPDDVPEPATPSPAPAAASAPAAAPAPKPPAPKAPVTSGAAADPEHQFFSVPASKPAAGWLTRFVRSLRGGRAPKPKPKSAARPPARSAPRPAAPAVARPPPVPEPVVDGADPFAPFARALKIELPPEPPALSAADEAAIAEAAARVLTSARAATGQLVSFPAVALDIVERANDPKVDARGLAGLIARDPALAADVVSVANSAAFRGVSEIESVHEAVARLGLGEVARVASAVAARKVLDPGGGARGGPSTELFVRAVAVASTAAAAALRRRGARSDHVWLGGLLHDVGKVLALQLLARTAAEPGAHLTPVALGTRIAERVHVEVGEAALQQWALPAYLREICAHHHDELVPAEAVDLHLVRLTSALATVRDPIVGVRAAREIVQSAAALGMDALAVRALAADLKVGEERARALVR